MARRRRYRGRSKGRNVRAQAASRATVASTGQATYRQPLSLSTLLGGGGGATTRKTSGAVPTGINRAQSTMTYGVPVYAGGKKKQAKATITGSPRTSNRASGFFPAGGSDTQSFWGGSSTPPAGSVGSQAYAWKTTRQRRSFRSS